MNDNKRRRRILILKELREQFEPQKTTEQQVDVLSKGSQNVLKIGHKLMVERTIR